MAQHPVGHIYRPRRLEDGVNQRCLGPRPVASARNPRIELVLLVLTYPFDFSEEIDVRVPCSVKDSGEIIWNTRGVVGVDAVIPAGFEAGGAGVVRPAGLEAVPAHPADIVNEDAIELSGRSGSFSPGLVAVDYYGDWAEHFKCFTNGLGGAVGNPLLFRFPFRFVFETSMETLMLKRALIFSISSKQLFYKI